MTEKRYLPLIQANGEWIDRPDLFLLARMSVADAESDDTVDHIFAAMRVRKDATGPLNTFEKTTEERHVRAGLRLRLFAGQALLELVRIAVSTGQAPSAAQGIKLAARNHLREFKKSSQESLEREVRRGLASYRNTAVLQAAMALKDPDVAEIEGSWDGTRRFLARARGLETFVDCNVVSSAFQWNPWRVPVCIEPNFGIKLAPLSKLERDFLALS